MRLLHAKTFQLKSFDGDVIPPYAILSHTWGEDEVSFQDIQGLDPSQKAGFKKIQLICSHAMKQELDYVWIDTCCIDKTSSAELSEAINSMYRWYCGARYCYAYLADVPDGSQPTVAVPMSGAFATSRWFSRGWTLQELLAPTIIKFYSNGGQLLGSRNDLSGCISSITFIGEEYLAGNTYDRRRAIQQASIAKKMSWCSHRKTTRVEDLAYCLLGLFGINMPLLYGEGEGAFVRLQEEIMKTSTDQSLFAWGYDPSRLEFLRSHIESSMDSRESFGPFAIHVSAFKNSGKFIPDELEPPTTAFTSTNMGLQISIRVAESLEGFPCPVAFLACRPEDQYTCLVGIALRFHSSDSFTRLSTGSCSLIPRDQVVHSSYRALRFLTNNIPLPPRQLEPIVEHACLLRRVISHGSPGSDLLISHVDPQTAWKPEQRILSLSEDDRGHIVLHLHRQNGEGYAVVLKTAGISGSQLRRWEYGVYQEHPKQPRGYEFYSGAYRFPAAFLNAWSTNIRIMEGTPVRTEKGISLRIIDIEHSNGYHKRHPQSFPVTMGGFTMTEMAHWSMHWGTTPEDTFGAWRHNLTTPTMEGSDLGVDSDRLLDPDETERPSIIPLASWTGSPTS